MPRTTSLTNAGPGVIGEHLSADLARRTDQTIAAAHAVAERAESWAKQNAPWQDRTGQARARLTVRVEGGRTGNGASATLRLRARHGVSYGRYLPDILGMTLDEWTPVLVQQVARIWGIQNAPVVRRIKTSHSDYVPGPYRRRGGGDTPRGPHRA